MQVLLIFLRDNIVYDYHFHTIEKPYLIGWLALDHSFIEAFFGMLGDEIMVKNVGQD